MVFEGRIGNIPGKILKDDGASTNIISKSFFNKNPQNFNLLPQVVDVCHSSQDANEQGCELVENAKIEIQDHRYDSNFVLADTRYDALLGTPWHHDVQPKPNYETGEVEIGKTVITSMKPESSSSHTDDSTEKVIMNNVTIKEFKSILKEPETIIFAVHVNAVSNSDKSFAEETDDPELKSIIDEYSEVFQSNLPPGLPPVRSVDHEIVTDPNSKIPYRRLFHLSPEELRATREYIEENLKNGRIRRSKSPYGAPLFFAKKEGKPLRAVVDYRLLNKITKRNREPTPRSDEMFGMLGESKWFTKIDLKTGFHQIRVKPEHVEKTAFQTKYGQYEFMVLPMGLCNAPATFSTMMNEVLEGLVDECCTVYLDDILIFSKSKAEHRKHVKQVLERLRLHKLYASPKKCHFMTSQVEFLGIIVSQEGLQVNPSKTKVIKKWPKPNDLSELRGFLGLASFFRRFIKNFSEIALPLTNLTKGGSGIHNWNESCSVAMNNLKQALISSPILRRPDFSLSYRCFVDASQFAIGSTLTQIFDGAEHVIAYFSRKLNPAQTNYTANDRELLGMIEFLKHFRCYLEGAEFEVITDNQVLKNFFDKKELSRREARWIETLSEFGIFPITLQKGRVHVLGDALSRVTHGKDTVELQNISVLHWNPASDNSFKSRLRDDQYFGPIIEQITRGQPHPRFEYKDGILRLKTGELCVPRSKVRDILELAHDSPAAGHFAYEKTLARLSNFFWRKKSRDVKNYVKGCLERQRAKPSNKKPLTLPTILELPQRRWGSISMDFIQGLPTTKSGFDTILTFVDRFSKRSYFIPCHSNVTAIDVANLLLQHVFAITAYLILLYQIATRSLHQTSGVN